MSSNTVCEQEQCDCQPAAARPEADASAPAVNIFETPESYTLQAEMPGVNKDGLELSVEGDVLTLVGRRSGAALEGLLYQESGQGEFRRTFTLAPTVNASGITAKMEQGVLTVTLPKAEKAKPHRISVN